MKDVNVKKTNLVNLFLGLTQVILSEGCGGAHSLVSAEAEDFNSHSNRRILKVIELFNSLKG